MKGMMVATTVLKNTILSASAKIRQFGWCELT